MRVPKNEDDLRQSLLDDRGKQLGHGKVARVDESTLELGGFQLLLLSLNEDQRQSLELLQIFDESLRKLDPSDQSRLS